MVLAHVGYLLLSLHVHTPHIFETLLNCGYMVTVRHYHKKKLIFTSNGLLVIDKSLFYAQHIALTYIYRMPRRPIIIRTSASLSDLFRLGTHATQTYSSKQGTPLIYFYLIIACQLDLLFKA